MRVLAKNRHYTQNPVNERYRLLQQQSSLRFAKVQCAGVQGNTARIWDIRIEIVDPPIFLKQIDERIPGFLKDLQPLMKATEQILAAPAGGTDLTKAVQAQVAVAAEHFGGMLAASANGFGLPAEAG